jgi:hypothetical protein
MLFRKKMERSCLYCRFGTKMNEEMMLCARKGIVPVCDDCRKFRYDPFSAAAVCHLVVQMLRDLKETAVPRCPDYLFQIFAADDFRAEENGIRFISCLDAMQQFASSFYYKQALLAAGLRFLLKLEKSLDLRILC